MKRLLPFACVIVGLTIPYPLRSAMPDLPVMPMPAQVERQDGSLPINGDFHVGVCGNGAPALTRAASRFAAQVSAETGLVLLTPVTSDCTTATLSIECGRIIAMPAVGDDESYKLQITAQSAHLTAATSTGVLRGLATFQQLIQPGVSSFAVPALSIEDHPRFPWRGLMLDVARHWMPMEVVERNLDAMAAVKLNVFHWHLSDNQGFRVESRVFPKLQGQGSDGHFYTQEQIRHVVAYAAERGIRVVPEFDIPGHATSWLVGYPELASAPGPYKIERQWGIFAPTIDPTKESTYVFLDRFFAEMATLFPDPYFHIGGDEVMDKQWKQNPEIQKFLHAHSLETSAQLHGYFNRRLQALIAKHGRTMIGWDEILNSDLPTSIVIQSWRGQESLAAAAHQGYRGLLSFGYYLDHMKPASFHYANDPMGRDAAKLTPAEAARILGGEACMWTEYVNAETVDSRIWPRLAAIAERLWSPANQTDVDSMYARMETVSRKLQWTGVKHLANRQALLDRISGFQSNPALTVLSNAVSSAGLDNRYNTRKYTSLEPLNRLVDASVAESEWIRHLVGDAHSVLAGPGVDQPAESRLRAAFTAWRNLPGSLAPSASQTILSAETLPVAETLSRLGETGSKALDFITTHQAPTPGWVDSQRPLLASASKFTSEVRISGADPVRVLLEALGYKEPSTPDVTGAANQ